MNCENVLKAENVLSFKTQILDGRVVVNGKLTSEPGIKVKPRKDIILVDGKKVILPDSKSIFWVVVNKPRAVLTTMADEKDRDTLSSIVPKVKIMALVLTGGFVYTVEFVHRKSQQSSCDVINA